MDPFDAYATAPPDSDTRRWALVCHLGGLACLLGIPGIVLPLVVWLIKRNDHPFIDAHGKEAVNFQISVILYGVALGAIAIVLWITVIGIVLTPLIGLAAVLLYLGAIAIPILAAVRASDGRSYRYPFTWRFIQ